MNVASLELCKELYELSGWKDTYTIWAEKIRTSKKGTNYTYTEWNIRHSKPHKPTKTVPAYEIGRIIRGLPKTMVSLDGMDEITIGYNHKSSYFYAGYGKGISFSFYYEADTPEDAACKLAIELFKQGILSQEEEN